MKLKQIQAENFKIFDELVLDLNGKSTVIFGVNGTGKSSILSIINYLFRVWINRINPSQGKAYESFNDEIVRIGESECKLSAKIDLNGNEFALSRFYKKKENIAGKKQIGYDKKEYSSFCDAFLSSLTNVNTSNMPIFVNYGTNRSVLDIPLRIRSKHEFDQISALERAIENELDFRTFFEWFRNQEDLENEMIIETGDRNYKDIKLKCVRTAIETMLGNVSDLKVKRNPLCMKVRKGNKEIRVDLLSDGEKCTLALFGDLARRIAIANPDRNNPLEGVGVVLIDEIELHMHPSWQRRVLGVLKEVFPNIQFIITTHSPQVLSEADNDYNILLLNAENNQCIINSVERMDGFDSNYILEEYMGTSSKNEKTKKIISEINHSIIKKQYSDAEELLIILKNIAGEDDAEVILAEGFLQKSRWLDEKNR